VSISILVAAAEVDIAQGEYNEGGENPSCSVDSSGDAPSKNMTRILPQTRATSENVKKFRTDTAPELDWYQPCAGGDNLINFYIKVHDVDVSSIKSATLTLAVWDVDYDCGTACDGI